MSGHGGGEDQIGEVVPTDGGQDSLAGGRGEAGGEADLDTGGLQRPDGRHRTGQWGHVAQVDGPVEGGLEGLVGPFGDLGVASEQLGEHVDLRLPHGLADVGGRVGEGQGG